MDPVSITADEETGTQSSQDRPKNNTNAATEYNTILIFFIIIDLPLLQFFFHYQDQIDHH